jgi:hypothetical protein
MLALFTTEEEAVDADTGRKRTLPPKNSILEEVVERRNVLVYMFSKR